MLYKQLRNTGLITLSLILLASCATKKRKSEVGGFKKFYHNMTAKYNGYFNANEIMEETFVSLELSNQDNYTDVLPIYTYSNPEAAKSAAGELDKAIEKVTTVATIHEVSDYVDDCYVLMGKAQYLKQDYETAEETFEFFQEEFNPNDPSSRNYKKKKKSSKEKRKELEEKRKEDKKIKDEERKAKAKAKEKQREEAKKIREAEAKKKEQARKDKQKERERIKKEREQNLKNRKRNSRKKITKKDSTATTKATLPTKKINTKPKDAAPKVIAVSQEEPPVKKEVEKVETENSSYYEGLLWLAKTYVERERYSSAEFLLRRMWDNPSVKESVRKEIPAAQAYLAIRQKKYNDAQGYLAEASEIANRKKDRARYAYILAQLREKSGDYSGARDAYELSKKLSSDYEMELNAELNMIKNDILGSSISPRSAEEKLLSLRKDNKNEEYKDRISLILADIAEASGDKAKTKQYLREALSGSAGNTALQAESYYRIASMEYNDEEYVEAKNYYDSTLTVMMKEDARYVEVGKLANGLKDIARNIEIIETQDSLIRMGSLSEDEKIEVAKKILKERKENPAVSNKPQPVLNKVKFSRSRTGASSFFAYDITAVERGKKSFEDKWGERFLQDNWRRSEALRITSSEEEEEVEEEVEEVSETDLELQKIIEKFPSSAEDIAKAEKRIETALFGLGKLYREKLDNYTKAIETHEELLRRFPNSNNELETFYYLYLSHLDLNNVSASNKYKNLMLENYPDAKFTLAISDPTYFDGINEAKMAVSNYYDAAFKQFEEGNYDVVASMIEEAEKKFGKDHKLRAKFALLAAMTTGNLKGQEEYIKALQDVITRYPNTPEQTRAREVMRFLKGDSDAFKSVSIDEVDAIFEEENEKLHYMIVVIFGATEEQFELSKIDISNYNKKKHAVKKLQLGDIGLNRSENTQIILIRKFKNKEKAIEYHNDITKNKASVINDSNVNYEVYPITQRNYRKVVEQKSVNNYRIWVEDKYLKKE